jgi:hypothetical protein
MQHLSDEYIESVFAMLHTASGNPLGAPPPLLLLSEPDPRELPGEILLTRLTNSLPEAESELRPCQGGVTYS